MSVSHGPYPSPACFFGQIIPLAVRRWQRNSIEETKLRWLPVSSVDLLRQYAQEVQVAVGYGAVYSAYNVTSTTARAFRRRNIGTRPTLLVESS